MAYLTLKGLNKIYTKRSVELTQIIFTIGFSFPD